MPRDYHDRQEWEEQGGAAPAGETRAARPPGKDSLSTLKDYVIIILLAVLVFTGVNNYILARSGSGGGCGGCSTASRGAAVSLEQLRRLGLEYYAANYGDTAVEAQVRDFGCHQEIYILKNGQVVKRLAYRGGQLYELPEV